MNKHNDYIKEGNEPNNELTGPIKEFNELVKNNNEPIKKLVIITISLLMKSMNI